MADTSPDITASIDQMGATLRTCAEALGAYRTGLIGSGLSEAVADGIVQDYAHRMHAMMLPAPNPLAGLGPMFGGGS